MKAQPVIIAIVGITDRYQNMGIKDKNLKIKPTIDKCSSISQLMVKLKRKYLFGRAPSRKMVMKALHERGYIELIKVDKGPRVDYIF